MVRKYDIVGRRVLSTPKHIVARTAPSREKQVVRDPAKSEKEYSECISGCVASQRECHTDAREAYQAAAKECRDNRLDCNTTCKQPGAELQKE